VIPYDKWSHKHIRGTYHTLCAIQIDAYFTDGSCHTACCIQLVCFNKLPLVVTVLADRRANTGSMPYGHHSTSFLRCVSVSMYCIELCVMSLSRLPVVLKFLKFHSCPEIRNCPEILLIWSECPEIHLCYAVITALPLFCTLYSFNWTLSVLLAYFTYYNFALCSL